MNLPQTVELELWDENTVKDKKVCNGAYCVEEHVLISAVGWSCKTCTHSGIIESSHNSTAHH